MKRTLKGKMEVGGAVLEYDKIEGESPGVFFLGGFNSCRAGEKGNALYDLCEREGRSFLRFDYSGHGCSGGDFSASTIGKWKSEALTVFDRFTEGEQIVVGSSMGGWLALMLASERRERVRALVAVAPAPDFTEELIRKKLTPEARRILEGGGRIPILPDGAKEPVFISREFLEEAREHLLAGKTLELSCPVHFLHGQCDFHVPPEFSIRTLRSITAPETALELIKGGDHRLSRPENLRVILERVKAFF
ncbi:alpha/beta hydrolase [bacterium]|nr:MAG: alpha/beta hydrolase [bacterium]